MIVCVIVVFKECFRFKSCFNNYAIYIGNASTKIGSWTNVIWTRLDVWKLLSIKWKTSIINRMIEIFQCNFNSIPVWIEFFFRTISLKWSHLLRFQITGPFFKIINNNYIGKNDSTQENIFFSFLNWITACINRIAPVAEQQQSLSIVNSEPHH